MHKRLQGQGYIKPSSLYWKAEISFADMTYTVISVGLMSIQLLLLKSQRNLKLPMKCAATAKCAVLKMPELRSTQAQKLPHCELPLILLWEY